MESFKVGDRVNFLNDKGGGVVKKIIDTRMVEVEIEEGFNVPVLISDLVLDFRTQPTRQQQMVDNVQKEIKNQRIIEAETKNEARRSELRRFARNSEEEGVYLAFIPHDQQWLLTGLIDVAVVNNTPADALYSFNLKEEGKYSNIDYGSIAPFSKVVVEAISRDDIAHWCEGVIQVILCRDEMDFVCRPLHAPFSLRTTRFFKDGSFVDSGLLGEKAMMISLATLVALKGSDTGYAKLMEDGVMQPKANKDIMKKEAAIDKHQTQPGEAVVDLHIGELVDNILGMSSSDIFRTQINYFKKMLDSAIENDYSKVTFIHGVGNGVLKNAIIEELKHYENTENRMAEISRFGVGAIDVIIRDKSGK